MKFRFTLLLLALSAASGLFAQPLTFFKFYDAPFSNYGDYAYEVIQTLDNGYVFTGTTLTQPDPITVVGHMMLFKADPAGNQLWAKEIVLKDISGDTCSDANGYALAELPDSTILIAGTCSYSLYLARTTKNGDTIWTKNYSSYYMGVSDNIKMCATNDGGFAVLGVTSALGPAIRLMKFTASGTLVWQKQYDYNPVQKSNDLKLAKDGGFIISGISGTFNDSAYLLRLNSTGDTIWTRLWNNSGSSISVTRITVASDSGFVLAGGNALSGGFICKMDANGIQQWLLSTPGYMSSGVYEDSARAWYSFSWDLGYLLGFQKINYAGDSILFSRTFGHAAPEYAGSFLMARDGGFVLCGYGANLDTPANTEAILIKTDTNGNMANLAASLQSLSDRQSLKLWPNPCRDTVHAELPGNSGGTIVVFTVTGTPVVREQLKKATGVQLFVGGLLPGTYIVCFRDAVTGEQKYAKFQK